MRKTFWEGFFKGLFIGSVLLAILNYHPYERCKRMYDTPNDVMECVWILENN